MIRKAKTSDIPAIVKMADRFYKTTDYYAIAPMDVSTVAELTEGLIKDGVMLVAEVDGAVVGMVGLAIVPFIFNSAYKGAYEVVWWVDPFYQKHGIGLQLLEAVEPACREHRVALIQMVHLRNSPPQVSAIYEAYKYHHSESSYTKVT